MKTFLLILFSATAIGMNTFAQGTTTIWNESVNGPLSNSGYTPTSLGLLQQDHSIIVGTTEFQPSGGGGGLVTADYFTFQVPANTAVSSLSFVVNKPVWVWLGDETLSNEIGFLTTPSNGDLFTQMGLSSLAAGTYGMYVANHDSGAASLSLANYQLDFSLVAAPEPSTIALGTLGVSALLLFRRRKK